MRITPGSLSRALTLIGDPWALQILKECFIGVRRFQDFQTRLGIPRQTLLERLERFAEHAILYKAPAKHERIVYEYRLTPKGADLYSFILMVWRLHRCWHLGAAMLPERLYHRACGHSMDVDMQCGTCREPIVPEAVAFEPGPGSAAPAEPVRRARIVNELQDLGPKYLATVILGDGWSVLVLNAVLRGTQNFDAIRKALRISSNVLSARLKTLLSLDLVSQEPNPEDGRKLSYRATCKGRDVYPLIISLVQWGDRWLAGSLGPPDVVWHTSCGHLLHPAVYCDHCGESLRLDDVSLKPIARKN